MADTNLLVLAREYKKLREEVKKVLSMPKGDKGDQGEKGEKGDKGDTGPQGFPGRDGKDGINGYDGKDGRDGVDGKDGKDGLDGIGVQNAYIDFDNSLVIVLTDGREVNAGFLSQETKDNVVATFKQGAATINELLPPQTGNANKFLKTNGTDVSWDTLDGSDIDLSSPPVIGNTTPNAATFTTLTATGQTSLGGAAGSDVFRVLRDNTFAATTVASFTAPQFSFIPPQNGFGAAVIGLGLNPRINSYGTDGQYFATNQAAGFSGTVQAKIQHTASAVNFVQVTGAATGGSPTITSQGSDATVPLNITTKGPGIIYIGSPSSATTSTVRIGPSGGSAFWASANNTSVNYLQANGGPTGNNPMIIARGTDANIGLSFGTLNDANIDFFASGDPNAGTGRRQLRVAPTTNAVNFVQVTGAATGGVPTISAQGTDTNIDLALTPKGTGRVRFGTYTATISAITGYIEIKDAGGTVRRLAVVA